MKESQDNEFWMTVFCSFPLYQDLFAASKQNILLERLQRLYLSIIGLLTVTILLNNLQVIQKNPQRLLTLWKSGLQSRPNIPQSCRESEEVMEHALFIQNEEFRLSVPA